MKVLVTGATGYLGSRLCRHLMDAGHRVTATGRDPAKAPAAHEFHALDLHDLTLRLPAALDFDAIVHCAALSASWGRRDDFHRHNVAGTASVLALAGQRKVPRFIHLSSPSIFAALKDQLLLDEDTPPPARFLNHYAESKHLAEQAVEAFHGPARFILRPQAIFGPGETTLVPRLLDANERGGLPAFPGRRPVIDITEVRDVIQAIDLCLHVPAAANCRTYHLTAGDPLPLHDLLDALFRRLGTRLKTRTVPYPAARLAARAATLFPRKSEPRLTPYTLSILAHSRTLSIRRARDELGYRPAVSIDQALDDHATYWNSRR